MDVCTLRWCIFKNNTPLFPLVYQRIHPRGMSRVEGGYYLRYAKKNLRHSFLVSISQYVYNNNGYLN